MMRAILLAAVMVVAGGCTVAPPKAVPVATPPPRIIVVPAPPRPAAREPSALSRTERRDMLDDAHESLDRATRMLDWLNGVNRYEKPLPHPEQKPAVPSPDIHP